MELRHAFRNNAINDKLGLVQWVRSQNLILQDMPIDGYILPDIQQNILQWAIGVSPAVSNLELGFVAVADN
eukprot:4113702-Pyramimonas_sp.AAC.1